MVNHQEINWQEQAQAFLRANQYEELTQLCQAAIHQGSEASLPYWYLGLVYLLQENIEEAQGVWLAGLFEAPGEQDSEQRTQQLASILEAEAQHQEAQEQFAVSIQLREQLQQFNPELNNLLKLLELSVQTHQFQSELIQEWQLIESLKAVSQEEVNSEQLQKTVILILSTTPTTETEDLLSLTFHLIKNKSDFLEQVLFIAMNYTFQKNCSEIGIKLAEICCSLKPNLINGIKKLSIFYTRFGQHKKAIQKARAFQAFCQTTPGKIEGSTILLKALLSAGSLSEAIQVANTHRELLKEIIINPPQLVNNETHDTFPLATFYLAYLADNARENRWFQNKVMQLYEQFLPDRDHRITYAKKEQHLTSKRRLRIGYIAHTFRKNAVGWLCRWLVQNHNREDFHITLYLIYQHEDELTQGFLEKADQVRRFDYHERKTAQQIIDDEIDILVDLDSLTVTPTCRTLCYRVAPVQVTWLGWDASGLPNMDYYIADPYVLPETAQEYYHETIWRLPNTYVAVKGFEVGVPSLTRKELDIPEDAIIYFSSQGAFKRHPDTVRLQMRILKAVPNSYFLIKGKSDQELIQNFFQEIAQAEGVDPNRLRFLPWSPNEFIHRANLGLADVVLDTYPYNGATTTLETLWMGIPLVTKVGQQFVARNSYTFLKNVGVEEGIAWTDEEYIKWGIKLGTDENLRRDVHWKLLQSRKTAPLWDVEQFVTDMETAYQQMWEKYVEQVKNYPVAEEATAPKAEKEKPKLRLLHNLPRCGGTLISKCLATMDNNLLLSEIHPKGMEMFNPLQQAHEWFNLLTTRDLNELATTKPISFVDAIERIHQRSQENNSNLIIRDWAHLDFFGVPWTNNLSYRLDLAETLKTHFELIQVAIVRHPIDQWLSLSKLAILQEKLTLEQFLKGYLEFAKIASQIGFIRYEDFTQNPDAELQTLCNNLEIPFDNGYKDKWQDYQKITGDIGNQNPTEISPQPRRQIEPETLQEIRNNQLYLEAITLLGYEDVK